MFPSAEFLSRPHQPSKEESEAILFFSFSFSSFLGGGKRLLGWIDRVVILFLRGLEEDLKIDREGEREGLVQYLPVTLYMSKLSDVKLPHHSRLFS